MGNFHGQVAGAPGEQKLYRSGLLDSTFRFSVNLKGGPAMSVWEYAKWSQETLVGVSFTMVASTGQYDPTHLINQGTNRWPFKPELGLSRRWGNWVVDAYVFTANNDFFSHNAFSPGTNVKTEAPIAAFQGHLSRDFRPRLWVSLDGNFWYGGQNTINGVEKGPYPSTQLTRGSYSLDPDQPAPIAEMQLQPRRLHPRRRRLSEFVGRMAIQLAGKTELDQRFRTGVIIHRGSVAVTEKTFRKSGSEVNYKLPDTSVPPKKAGSLSSRLPDTRESVFQTVVLVCLVATWSYIGARLSGTLVLRPQMAWVLWPGNAAMNQKLRMERAQEVIVYLIQDCNVSVRHVVAPAPWVPRTRRHRMKHRRGARRIAGSK